MIDQNIIESDNKESDDNWSCGDDLYNPWKDCVDKNNYKK